MLNAGGTWIVGVLYRASDDNDRTGLERCGLCGTPEEGLEPPTRRLTAVCSTN